MDRMKTSINIPQLFGNKIKPTDERFGLWLLLENLWLNNLITDVGNIDYTNGEEKLDGNGLSHPITEPFCDNIMVVKICDLSDCETRSTGKTQIVLKKEQCGSFNSYLRGKFSNFVSVRHGVKAKLPFLLSSDNRIAKGLSSIIKKEDWGVIHEKYKTPVAIPYKIELADVKLDTLLDKITCILRELENELYYLVDLDITQDFGGIFSKPEMIKFLTNKHDFCYQGESRKNSNVIIDNYKTVGNDCLTWHTSNARVKIYNKFVCQMTSPGVNKIIGNHVIDFLYCPDKRLKGTFYSTLAREHGITRLEATIYNYTTSNENDNNHSVLDPVADCKFVLENSKTYFLGAPFYSVPMWTKLSETLQNSCCLVFNNLLQYVYWGNRNTRKLTGLQFRLPEEQVKREKLIKFALSAYSFNLLPINYLEITPAMNGNQNEINISLKSYIKQGGTYFTKTSTPFSFIPKEINISDAGLVDTPNILPHVLRKKVNAGCKLYPFPLKEIPLLRDPFVTSGRKRHLELEEMETKKRKLNYTQTTKTIREEYKDQLAKEEQIRIDEKELISYFMRKWGELATNGFYELYAFAVCRKDSFIYVGVLVKKEETKSVHYLKGLCKTRFVELSDNSTLLNSAGFVTLTYSTQRGNEVTIFYLPSKEPFGSFTTNGITSFKGNIFPKVENLCFYNVEENTKILSYTQDVVDQVSKAIMQNIKGSTKVSACHRLEDLDEGLELIVCGIKKIVFRNKIRYILQFENIKTLYLSNYWLEKEIDDLEVDLNYKLKIKLDRIKITATKKKERVVFCVY